MIKDTQASAENAYIAFVPRLTAFTVTTLLKQTTLS